MEGMILSPISNVRCSEHRLLPISTLRRIEKRVNAAAITFVAFLDHELSS